MGGFATLEDTYHGGHNPVSRPNFLLYRHRADGSLRPTGTLWNFLTGTQPVPRFRVTTASVDGRAVAVTGQFISGLTERLTAIHKTDLIFIPTTGLSLDDVVVPREIP